MDKEKEIEEMATICGHSCEMWYDEECLDGNDCKKCEIATDIAEELINAGYRKADEVRKETAKEIWNKLYQKADNTCNNRLNLNKQDIRFFAAQDGVEVAE